MIEEVIQIAIQAGKEIMKFYKKDITVQEKEDKTPITEADRRAHEIIVKGLQEISEFPIISEEGKDIPYEERRNWEKFWLVDPLDGTKEFIKKLDEFTVNIALIEKGIPTLGVVYAPAKSLIYFSKKGVGSYKGNVIGDDIYDPVKIPLRHGFDYKLRIVASRSHLDERTKNFINQLSKYYPVETVSAGSSLKFCLVAEGNADVYPRFSPTMEWDTAAGHAVLLEAGGFVYSVDNENFKELKYNKKSLRNPPFVAFRRDVAQNLLSILK